MTREEAIYELKNAAWLGTDHSRARTEEAVEMAISALDNKTPCSLCRFRNEDTGICDMCPAIPFESSEERERMKVLIDIDENVYTRLFDCGTEDMNDLNSIKACNAIRKGTPIPDNATVCDIEQIRAEIYHECCAKYQKTCEIYKKAFGQMRAEVEELKDGFIDNTKVINAVQI